MNLKAEKAIKYLLIFLCGGVIYSFIEILWRGFTHWSMTVTGGLCFVCLYLIHKKYDAPLWKQCAAGSLVITAFELAVGVIVNLAMDWNVWDYSDLPMNVAGQICLPFMMIWFAICLPAKSICVFLDAYFFSPRRQKASRKQ